jgi:hypothetical protein
MMIQTVLLPGAVGADRWQPVVSPYHLRPAIKVRRTKPLPSQMSLPGMGPTEDSGTTLLLPAEDESARCGERRGGPQPTCPNCGGREFDEDGDCTSCWEPGVVEPPYGRRKATRSQLSLHPPPAGQQEKVHAQGLAGRRPSTRTYPGAARPSTHAPGR